MSSPTTLSFDLDGLGAAMEGDDLDAAGAFFAADVVWTDIDARTPPSAPGVVHGRDAVLAGLRDAHDRGIRSRLDDGFVSGDRAAVAIHCTYPSGGRVVTHALLTLRDGRIVRWDGVQAWDE
jgi:ketosteroid isomerase-like protein